MHSPLAALNSWELDSIIVRDLEVAQRYANGEKVYNTPKVPYTLIESPAELKDLLWSFVPNSRVTMDTETTGLSHATDHIIDIGWYDGTGMAYILPLLERYGERKWDDQTLREYTSLVFDFWQTKVSCWWAELQVWLVDDGDVDHQNARSRYVYDEPRSS